MNKKIKMNKGMTYIELIVVLSIFSVLSSVVIFNYNTFQGKVDVKNLATDIALKAVEAQKASASGKLPPSTYTVTSAWKPAYGVYFNVDPSSGDNKSFIYFVDLENDILAVPTVQDGVYGGTISSCAGECIEKTSITKGNTISRLDLYYRGDTTPHSITSLGVSFSRVQSGAVITPTAPGGSSLDYAQLTVTSPKSTTALIKIYPSGRIQIN